MGLCMSKVERDFERLVENSIGPLAPIFRTLRLGRSEQRKLFEAFDRMDKDGGRSIDFEEFCAFFRIEPSKFSRRCFLMLDAGGSGEMNFAQFCVCAWNYCTYDSTGLAMFAFQLYDDEGLGFITNEKMFTLVSESYDLEKQHRSADFGFDMAKNSPEYQMAMAKKQIAAAAGADEKMQLGEFLLFCRKHPNLLGRAFQVQHKLQMEICGPGFWSNMTNKRRKMTRVGEQVVDFGNIDELLHALQQQYSELLARGGGNHRRTHREHRTQEEEDEDVVAIEDDADLTNELDPTRKQKSIYGVDRNGKPFKRKMHKRKKHRHDNFAARDRAPRASRSPDIRKFDRDRDAKFRGGRQKRLVRKKSAEKIQAILRSRMAKKRVNKRRQHG